MQALFGSPVRTPSRNKTPAVQEKFLYRPRELVTAGPLKLSPIGFGTWSWHAPNLRG